MLENPLSVYRRCCENLAQYCKDNGIKFLVTGVSGGLDSAVVLGIVKGAKIINRDISSIGVMMPCHSSEESITRGREAIVAFKENEKVVNLTGIYDVFSTFLNHAYHFTEGTVSDTKMKIVQGNIKARLRMITLYYIANLNNGMVMSTDNLSEYLMGFWTLHGDVGDYGPIQKLWKGSELYDIAKAIGVPQSIIDARPDDGLGVTNGGDEAQLGASYTVIDEIMDNFLKNGFEPNGSRLQLGNIPYNRDYSVDIQDSLMSRCLNSAFKRNNPINLTRADLGLEDYPTV